MNLIVAMNKDGAIGKRGGIPWHCSADLKWFKEKTINNIVIMGRKTYESIGKPLKDRYNIIISSDNLEGLNESCHVAHSIENAVDIAEKISKSTGKEIYVIGGASIYKQFLDRDLIDTVYIDIINEEVEDADSFLDYNQFLTDQWHLDDCGIVETGVATYRVKSKMRGLDNNLDDSYLNLVNDIIENGECKDTRAGLTRSVFSRQLRINLKDGLPMLTTKKMFSKGVIHELLWFIKGDTNIKYLVDNGVHIWDDDAYRYYIELCETHKGPLGEGERYPSKEEFLTYVKQGDSFTFDNGVHYTFGDLNRVYGAQWTNWGGHNQIHDVIETLKTNPDDRRMIISAWNVDEIPDMALPPCHFCCQFYTKKMTFEERVKWATEHCHVSDALNTADLDALKVPSRKLSCAWHQRSVDSLLGLPFNIMSYAILTHMIAQCANMAVDELIFDGGDVHVYENQITAYNESQKLNNPHKYALPTLKLNPEITNIDDFTYEDIHIEGYKSYPTVKYPLSVG